MSCCGGDCTCGKNGESTGSNALQSFILGGGNENFSHENVNFQNILPEDEIVEVRFKNNRKAFFRNSYRLVLEKQDRVVVKVNNGIDVGTLVRIGSPALSQFKKLPDHPKISSLPKVERLAQSGDIENWLKARKKDRILLKTAQLYASKLGLSVDIHTIECRSDHREARVFLNNQKNEDLKKFEQGLIENNGMNIELVAARN